VENYLSYLNELNILPCVSAHSRNLQSLNKQTKPHLQAKCMPLSRILTILQYPRLGFWQIVPVICLKFYS